MRSKMMPFAVLTAVLMVFLLASSCGNGSNVCPVCGTTTKGGITEIGIMLVPEHNGNGEPGGPFNVFDISWVDSVNHFYYVSDRIGLDVPMFSTVTDIAVAAIGGDNSVAEAGNDASVCFDAAKGDPAGSTIPPLTSAQGNYTRFGCKTLNFTLPGFFGANGHFGGFLGGQCCASRANNLNPLTGPNGIEASPDGDFLYVGNGSANVLVFDMTQTIATNGATFPKVTADLVTGSSPDYDGLPNGISACMASANGRAFSDPTCGDLRGDELATTGSTPRLGPDGKMHDLLMVINGDPGMPFVSVFDITNVIHPATPGLTQSQIHCLPSNPNSPFSPGGPMTTFEANFSSCMLGQIYYDLAGPVSNSVVVDEGNGFPCPDPSLQFANFTPVPSGATGDPTGFNTVAGPCHHGPILDVNTGVFDPTCNPVTTPTCQGAISPAGLGGMVYNPATGHFLLTNGNSTANTAVGSVDEIDPFFVPATGPVAGFPNGWPAVINSFPANSCMSSGVNLGPGTDVLVACAGHDGRQFAPTTLIINGSTGAILQTINNVGGVDESWFNPGDGHYYLAARDMPTGPVLGVIDGPTRQFLQNVPTNGNAHSVAADAKFNKIYVPLPAGGNCQSQAIDGCVGIYAAN